ncbi:hypothetical protein CHGG_06875 [Chaetomium globosum CBS 148.51]|uniref:Peptidase M16 C-terminal domain-containing protein n=1 Tax=Chaetomium globosum (strain ATCC 6205 / CBS 148.51 / DSM 1962 / NBRC 6347 / NRRL 1970) TaxID=306901 RepID=Q2GYS9_CHAGB|nr:uncharacterized protein CHGG_06875 [Chaetomium globosum CBS 148.51]EAQ85622.1 hypothetical protein CHGG_06875 [Chaetomium globosum CBS 148.51]
MSSAPVDVGGGSDGSGWSTNTARSIAHSTNPPKFNAWKRSTRDALVFKRPRCRYRTSSCPNHSRRRTTTSSRLLFMGNKKFPDEHEYKRYISNHSGSANAYTMANSTNFHFEVSAKPDNGEAPSVTNPSPLLGALDRFAQFFIGPLFLKDTLDRELLAVNSEHQNNLQSDRRRLAQLEKCLSNPKDPFCHFSSGNLETLKIAPEAQGINVRDKFIDFYEKHYSANRMKLCVLGQEPLDILQTWVIEHFSAVKNKNLAANRCEEALFTEEQLGIQIFAKPVMDIRTLTLTFLFIEQEYLYESQPGQYISHLIHHEGPRSIISHLKSKGWANELSATARPISPGSPNIFACDISLTEEFGPTLIKEGLDCLRPDNFCVTNLLQDPVLLGFSFG